MIRFLPAILLTQVSLCIFYLYTLQSSHWSFNLLESMNLTKERKLQPSSEKEAQVLFYEVRHFGKRKTCGEILKALSTSNFTSAFNRFLANSPFKFYFLIMTPFQAEALERSFTIALIKSESPNRYADPRAYSEYFKQCENSSRVMTFRSKTENTLLIAPCKSSKKYDEYQFIGSFFANAPKVDQLALLSEIRKQVDMFFISQEGRRNEPIFVNTHGLDVPWLHIRLETPLPKHYAEQKIFYDRMD